jgi:hypothetical protein
MLKKLAVLMFITASAIAAPFTPTPAQKLQADTQKLIMLQASFQRGSFTVAGSTTPITMDSVQLGIINSQITAQIAVVQADAEALGQ